MICHDTHHSQVYNYYRESTLLLLYIVPALNLHAANGNRENKTNQFLGASMNSDGERFVVNQL